ncbi:MAG: ATP-binding protein [Streptosporangiaceae bacterium]
MSASGRPERPPRLRELTVQGWFRLVFAVLGLLVVVAALAVVALTARTRNISNELSGSILPAQAQAYRLQGALVDQETGVRGYGITADPRFLQPYTAGRATERAAAAGLRTEIGRTQPLAGDLGRLERAADGWRAAYALPLISRARSGPLNGKDLTLLNHSKSAFDHLRALFAVQNTHLASVSAADRASLARARNFQDAVYGVILGTFLLAAAALAVLLDRAVIRPLHRLRAASDLVAEGDYSHHIRPSGPADLWAMSAAVERMRSELVTALETSRAAQAVAARQAADLDAQAAELLRSNGELEQFAYVASHDLQEPLRKVASFCQLLEKRYSDKLDERGLKYIEFAVDGAKRMQILINDLLTFSRVGRASDVRVPVPLDQPLDAATTALSAAIEETGAVIERPGPLPEVMGDPTLLGMLWQNLIGNAIKFRAADRSPEIRITADEQRDGGWQIGVADNGIGVPAEFAEKIFIIFQRLHGRDSYPGTGIGLALCKRIVEQHGGQMLLDTSYSGGTRIYFTLPAPATAAGLAGRPGVIARLALPPSGASAPAETGDENTGITPEGTPHVRPGTDRSPARRG